MLKPYIVCDEVSIDGGKWRKLDSGIGYSLRDDKDANTKLIVDSASFMEFFNILEKIASSKYGNRIYGTVHHLSAFRKRPIIGMSFNGVTKYYRTFESVSIRTVYKEIPLTLQEIMHKFDADLVIQYLKEHGLTACPLITGG